MSTSLRVLFIMMAVFIYIGIYLTGHNNVHWFSWVPMAALAFAGITGFCPGLKILKAIGLK
ncbi:MAG: hypothetical protein V3V09_01785 [Arenicellales bacterium]